MQWEACGVLTEQYCRPGSITIFSVVLLLCGQREANDRKKLRETQLSSHDCTVRVLNLFPKLWYTHVDILYIWYKCCGLELCSFGSASFYIIRVFHLMKHGRCHLAVHAFQYCFKKKQRWFATVDRRNTSCDTLWHYYRPSTLLHT